ncbi:acyltransferase [Bacteroides sp.]
MTTDRKNIGWIDLLRVLACFLVVFSHSSDAFTGQFDNNRAAFLTGVFSGSFVRCCVPLFVMMTSVLLLPVKDDLAGFYRRRIGRILVPLVFWSIITPILFFLYFTYVNPGTQNPLFTPDPNINSLWVKLYTFIFNFNFDTVPMWYLYMLIGLYFIMPILSHWLQQASRKDIKLVLMLWGVSLFIPYLKMAAPLLGYQGNYGNMGLWGVCDWNDYGTFYYVSGFIGYLILAYYLVKFPLNWSWKKMLAITIPMFLVGYAVTSYGYILTQNVFPGNYAYLEIVWYFAGINVFMMTFPVFVIIRKIKIPSLPWLSHLASLTFGIYLCHYVFVFVCYDWFDMPSLPYFVRIVMMASVAFCISSTVAWLMSKSKLTKRFVR